jgi:2-dehydropantoate 2-reductase
MSTSVHEALWTKFLLMCAFGGVASVARATSGEILDIPETRSLLREAMAEVAAVAAAHDIELGDDIVTQMMDTAAEFAPATRPSMLVDLEAGKRIELDALNGAVVRLGSAAGVPTPANRFIYATLKPADSRARRGLSSEQ